MTKLSFATQQNSFFRTLKQRVDQYFSSNELHTNGNFKLYFKGLLHFVSAVTLYIVLVFFTPTNLYVSLALCAVLGLTLSLIGFNIMHEGGHQSFSKKPWMNQIAAYSLNILGGNADLWRVKHNVKHHTYTNIEGADDDLDIRPLMRLHENQKRYWFHRFQHIYWILLYGIAHAAWIFYRDFQKYFTGQIAFGAEQQKRTLFYRHLIFWITKIAFVFIYFLIPIYYVGVAETFIGFGIVSFACGFFMSVVFQLAHVVGGTAFPTPDPDTNKVEHEWAVHQLTTTANFATRNKFLSWLLGGLNFQVEHHLFPRISHVYYPVVNQLVKETCAEFDVRYIEYPSMGKALRSHILHLKDLGRTK